jgi:hypothetical protein
LSAQECCARRRAGAKTFSQVAAQYIVKREKSWKNAKHQAQWAATLRPYAEPVIGKLVVRNIRPEHVIAVLEPIWTSKTETATRVRSRIGLVQAYAAARVFREGSNPARWKGILDAALPDAAKVAPVRHHDGVAVKDVPSLMRRLGPQEGTLACDSCRAWAASLEGAIVAHSSVEE